ncbi:hypothetical protein Y032_0015g2640 [Ancylostoma ceylanicum]|uniref:Uncharacterized protein n=1 Tax=Ancylostoma ceylanicum TaxID=53326 RepID=A0A016V7K4_9BILA|nr:hypothetical protein Y032_0015g2640 [Ancylostoma ceylanicum]
MTPRGYARSAPPLSDSRACITCFVPDFAKDNETSTTTSTIFCFHVKKEWRTAKFCEVMITGNAVKMK